MNELEILKAALEVVKEESTKIQRRFDCEAYDGATLDDVLNASDGFDELTKSIKKRIKKASK